MMIIKKGHKYAVDNFEDKEKFQEIVFIEKEALPDGTLTTVQDGTTNEELIRVLIDRLQHMNQGLPCRENSLAITKLEEALMWLKRRTEDRKERGVYQTTKP